VDYAAALEPTAAGATWPPAPPPLQPGQAVPWSDLARFVEAFLKILSTTEPLEYRLRHILALANQCRELRFDKVMGPKLGELLGILTEVTAEELRPAEQMPPPGWTGRMVFRQLAAVYARKDSGPNRGTMSQIGWLRRMWAGYRFAGGRGAVPPVNGLLPPSVTFEQGEQPAGTLPPDAEQLLTRYFHVKLESMQFFGKTNFDLPFWAGLDSLLFTFPVTLWLGRLLTTPQRGRTEAIGESLRIVDDSFGFNPLLAGKQASGVKVLAAKGELPRLIVWYGA
jgi:lysine-N-methylase